METTKKSYSEKLKDPRWQKKRLEILSRDNFTCLLCDDTETELHINHLQYTGEPWDAPNEFLETLCKHCHKLKHYISEEATKHGKDEKILKVIKTGSHLFYLSGDGSVCIVLKWKDDSLFFLMGIYDTDSIISNITKLKSFGNGK